MSDKARFLSKTGAYVVGQEPNYSKMLSPTMAPLQMGANPADSTMAVNDFFTCPWCNTLLDRRDDPDYIKIYFYEHMTNELNESFEENNTKMRARNGYLVSLLPDPALRRLLEGRVTKARNNIVYEKSREYRRNIPDPQNLWKQEYPSSPEQAEGAERAV